MSADPPRAPEHSGARQGVPSPDARPAHPAPEHAVLPHAGSELHSSTTPEPSSQGGSQSTPVYLSVAARRRSRGGKPDRPVLVTASLKVPPQVKARWSSEASRRGIRLSEHLRLLLESVDPCCAEDGKNSESDQTPDDMPGQRDRRIRWVAARRWSPQHGEMMGVLLQIQAELRQIQRAVGDAGQASSTSDLIELNALLSRLSRRLDSCCAQFALDKPRKRGAP